MCRVVSLCLPFWATGHLQRHASVLPVDGLLITRGHDGCRTVIAAVCQVARAPELAVWGRRLLPLPAVSS